MTAVRKQKKKKTFNNNINRKRLRNRLSNLGPVECDPIKDAWNRHRSTKTNLRDMGLAYDANKLLSIPSYKQIQKAKAISIVKGDFTVTEEQDVKPSTVNKPEVVQQLMSIATAPRLPRFRIPNSHVEYITYFMDKYGTDFKAMAKDRNNYNQETWRQLRSKVKKFMRASRQYAQYLHTKGQLHKDISDEDLKKQAEELEMDSD